MTAKKKPAQKPVDPIPPKIEKCSVCHAVLRDPSEWVRSKKKIWCSACYQGLLYPNRKLGSQEIID